MPKNDDLRNRLDELFTDLPATPEKVEYIPEKQPHLGMLYGALDDVAMGLTIIDLEGSLIHVNRAFCDLMGYPEEELVGYKLVDFLCQDDRHVWSETMAKLSTGDENSCSTVLRLDPKNLDPISTEFNISVRESDYGKPLHFVNFVQLSSQRESTERELNEIRAQTQTLLDYAPEAIVIVDVDSGLFAEPL